MFLERPAGVLQKLRNGAFSSPLCKLQPKEKTRTLMREGAMAVPKADTSLSIQLTIDY